MLRHHVDATQSSWVRHVPMVEFAINMAKHSSTGLEPYRVLYGLLPRDYLSVAVPFFGPVGEPEEAADALLEEQQYVRQVAQYALTLAQTRQKMQYDKTHRDEAFEVGDRVMLSTKHLSPKLSGFGDLRKLGPRYIGPFVVEEKRGDLAYKLNLPDGWSIHDVFSVTKLRKARDGEYSTPPAGVMEVRSDLPGDVEHLPYDPRDVFRPFLEADSLPGRRESPPGDL
jgi:hypothetical protein